MSQPETPWSQYDQAYKQIHERLSEILTEFTSITDAPSPWSTTATSSGDNTVKTPSTGKKLRIKLVDVWNNGSGDITVYLKFGAPGTPRFKKTLAAKTGFALNLVNCNWEGATNEALIANLSTAGTVDITVLGKET